MMHLYIIGFGNQARAWAYNLRDSNAKVTIALRQGSPSIKLVGEDFPVVSIKDIPENSNIALLTPDETHEHLVDDLSTSIKEATFIYAHGHSMVVNHLAEKFPQYSHVLFAPKGIAKAIREYYLAKKPLAAATSLEYSRHKTYHQIFIKELAKLLGITEVYPCTFAQETKADLFSEQSLLCSILPYAANLSFRKLREKGIPKEVAYLECWYEVKLIADTMVTLGPEKFFDLISPNALVGSEFGKNALLSEEFQKGMESLFANIESGKFDNDVKSMDIRATREKINHFWKNQELTAVHNELAPKLFALNEENLQ